MTVTTPADDDKWDDDEPLVVDTRTKDDQKAPDKEPPKDTQKPNEEDDSRIRKERAIARQANARSKQLESDFKKAASERDDFKAKYEALVAERTAETAKSKLLTAASKHNAVDPELVADYLSGTFNPDKDDADEVLKQFKKERPSQFRTKVQGGADGGSGTTAPSAAKSGWLREALKGR